jgi:hypothetical protein
MLKEIEVEVRNQTIEFRQWTDERRESRKSERKAEIRGGVCSSEGGGRHG